jgi:bifunctional UDP-N-acetylglucosamine pyrophosphorylase/glucosamine-1-phosphate N-acetyltransferase
MSTDSGQACTAIILAAGQGTRMKSGSLPKAMFTLCGRPLVHYPVSAALEAGASEVVVVVGHGRELVERYLAKTFGQSVKTAVQERQLGTGDAAKAGMRAVSKTAQRVIVFVGDVPLITANDLQPVIQRLDESPKPAMAMATCTVERAHGYGRILREANPGGPLGNVVAVREERDLENDAQRAIREINPGIYAAPRDALERELGLLTTNNAQGEYYLTDVVAAFAKQGLVASVASPAEVLAGVNDRQQLAEAEAVLYARVHRRHRLAGVTVRDGARIDDGIEIGQDSVIEAGAILRGATKLGEGVLVDVGCVLTDVVVESGAILKPYSVATNSTVGPKAQIGPFSHLRPESAIGEEAHIGNFVETKKTSLGKGAKANHLAYLGDGVVGAGANVGAGTIFCNYDGFQKHVTVIEDGAFIGSDSQLVAPVRIGRGAYVGTGTTVTKDVPADALALSRVRQENKEGYAERLRGRLKAAKEAKSAKK